MAESVHSNRDVPPFRNSAMDGYAVRGDDVQGASAQQPVTLKVLETIAAGAVPQAPVTSGTAVKIMTGSPMPDGADTVVRVEDTSMSGDTVKIVAAPSAGTNVRHPGEDIRIGDTVLEEGHSLRPADIGLLASLGMATVLVRRRPVVAILATGDELVELGEPLAPGQIANSNAYTLAAAVEEAGAIPRLLGIVRDDMEIARAAFAEALQSDVVLSTGGVSMGNFDLVRDVLASLGVKERFWKVAQKPGRPLAFGMHGDTPVFGLPGYPVSSLLCFYVYVRPVLRKMMGLSAVHLPVVPAVLEEDLKASDGLTDFVRCVLEGSEGNYRARVTGSQGSGVLRSMSLGGGLIIVPADVRHVARGSSVRVLKLRDDSSTEAPVAS